ncbi:MAG: hypothetical protein QXD02_04535 [Candidatus Parvarchaeum sp.]|jgi:hypothetical protein|nr:type II toxin-antitoxin system CcdA family antitoxin [Candidatus Parvarchaeum tengchongense]MCW1295284.1 type II toxin-antitoxin system CcdA family antitoxin [Candidatus Parvarchaeum tengchongense]MCW1299557.1 type II toxin-antitoxin system CcdA family antitoxin [Candidatus Parvarchaeum tengchongense]
MTNKRNTLLYLDKDLVAAAKKAGLNLSLVAEESLRARIPYFGKFEPKKYLLDSFGKTTITLPVKIESMSVTGLLGQGEKVLHFKNLNVVISKKGDRRHLMSIVLGRVFEADPIFNHFHLPGKVEVTIAKGETVKYNANESESASLSHKCIVTYDLFENLNEEARLQLLKYMISTNAQLIINDLDMVKGMENFNVIEI